MDPPWDELREQRVLAGVLERRREDRARARARGARFVRAGALVAAAAAILLAVVAWRRGSMSSPVVASGPANAPATAAPSATGDGPEARQQRLALADGSQAVLLRDATLQVQEQRADLVHIVQQTGSVRYEVRPDPAREFVVYAAGASVRVRGTVFTVTIGESDVEVHVQRGKVEVDDGTRSRDLVVGEALRVPVRAADASDAGDVAPLATQSRGLAEPAARPRPGGAPSEGRTFDALLARADSARASGNQDEAAAALNKVVALFPSDPRTPSALFTLGKVERARGHLEASAQAFERCWRGSPAGPLAEDALAEAAQSRLSAGDRSAAGADAGRYLARWPGGLRAPQMRAITGP